VAPVLVHVSVVDCPGLIVIGFAVSFTLSVELLVGRTSSFGCISEAPGARLDIARFGIPRFVVGLPSPGAVGDLPWHAINPIAADHTSATPIRFMTPTLPDSIPVQ
jgi:hypothetical protein